MKILPFFICFIFNLAWAGSDLRTLAEKTSWKETGRAEETARLCRDFAKAYPKQVTCRSYGVTPEGRKLLYLSVGAAALPAVWVQAGIHAGEIDGKDAVFLLLRELLEGKHGKDMLKKVRLVFVPIVNLDGHERFGAWNRPNQVGPAEMGWRTTAQNLNMNRDFAKAEAPEMRALLGLWHAVDPVLSLDLHVTDGAQFQPEVGLIVHPHRSYGASPLHHAGKAFEESLMRKMAERGRKALPFYPSFEEEDRPSSGVARYVSTAKYAHGYWSNCHRLAMLVETHSWKDYATRVKTHHATVLSSLELAAANAASWRQAAREAESDDLAQRKSVPLAYKHTEKSHPLEFAGYKYKISKSEVSGAEVIKYFPDQPEVWTIPFYEELVPSLSVAPPREGYLVPPSEHAWLLPKLKLHGIKFRPWKGEKRPLQIFRASGKQFGAKPFEGLQGLVVQGEWKAEETGMPTGTVLVPLRQPKGRLLMQLLEPLSGDSFLAWGFFNRHFERKEYMENYVAEDVAKEMLAKNPAVREEFEARLKDKEFAADPAARFEFFYRKHPSWDERYDRYPIFRL